MGGTVIVAVMDARAHGRRSASLLVIMVLCLLHLCASASPSQLEFEAMRFSSAALRRSEAEHAPSAFPDHCPAVPRRGGGMAPRNSRGVTYALGGGLRLLLRPSLGRAHLPLAAKRLPSSRCQVSSDLPTWQRGKLQAKTGTWAGLRERGAGTGGASGTRCRVLFAGRKRVPRGSRWVVTMRCLAQVDGTIRAIEGI